MHLLLNNNVNWHVIFDDQEEAAKVKFFLEDAIRKESFLSFYNYVKQKEKERKEQDE